MIKESKWEFASTGGSPDDGIHNSMIEHFAGNYNYYLAREIIQNSLDAKIEGSKEPVTVEFKLEFFSSKEFPGYADLKEVFKKCKNYWIDEDTHVFIDNANKCLDQKVIPFLKISDYNTKGLSGGDYEKNGTWYKLVKSRGSSSKTGGEGGSFGIGKGAPFAASDLRIVFYSTKNETGFTIFQGIAELVSFEENKDVKRGIGSFGDGQHSIKDRVNFPSEKFWRKATGTDIYIAGYKNNDEWESDLIKSVLRNFWYAIFKNELKVIIEGNEISSLNLETYLTANFSGEPYRDDVKPVGNPLQYYLTVSRGRFFPGSLPILGNVSFYFMDTEEYLNHVAMMRKSHMIIFSRLFRFPGSFAGVFICDNEGGNSELRKMEPPAHDEWIPNRNLEKGKKIYAELTSFIKECLEKSKIIRKSEYSEIPDLYKYLPDNEDGDIGEGTGQKAYSGKEGLEETSQVIQKKEIYDTPITVAPFKIAVINKKNIIDDDEEEEIITPIDPEKPKPRKKRKKNPENIHIRVFNSSHTDTDYKYSVIVKGNKKAKYDLRLFSVGEDLMEKLILSDVSQIDGQQHFYSANYIRGVWLEKDKETRFTIIVKSKFKNAIKIELNEVQQ